jgi:hypothetical protein
MGQGEGGMDIFGPLFFPVGVEAEGGEPFPIDPYNGMDWMSLPPGLAFRMIPGQRWTLDLHYINVQDRQATVKSGFNARLVDPGDVQAWVAPAMFDAGRINLPPGDSEVSFDCAFEAEYDVLSIMAHMHYYGRSFTVELVHASGEVETVFEIPEWTPNYKEWPRIQPFELGSLHVLPGDAFRTTCAWTNETGVMQPDPAEMCTLELVLTPLDRPLVCIDGQYIDQGGP